MAIMAVDSVTIASITDVQYMRRYYLLQASTLAAPAVPTTNPPPGSWGTTEPSYTEGSTNTLYTTDLVVFSDATFDYLPVQKSSSYEAAKVAYNKALAAQGAADAANNNAISRGADLVTNGTGLLNNNTNFSQFVFDPLDAPVGAIGSFADVTYMSSKTSDALIPIDPSKKYIVSAWARQTVAGKAARAYLGLAPFDAVGMSIEPLNYVYDPETMTTLTAPLNPGATTIQVANLPAASWTSTPAYKYLGIWNYADPNGRVWPSGTYTRNIRGFASVSGTTITLSAAYNGPAMPVGTPISRNHPGGSFMYTTIINVIIPETWTNYRSPIITGLFDGRATSPTGATTTFPQGTASVRILVLGNRDVTGGKHAFAGISMSEASAAQTTAEVAQITASGKNKVLWSLADAPTAVNGAVGTANGDVWNKYVLASNKLIIVASWTSDGTTWKPSGISESYVPQIAIGTGTYGELDGLRLKANSVQANAVVVEGSVGNILLADGAVNARTVNAQSVAGAVGSFLSIDAKQLTVTGTSTLDTAVVNKFYTDMFFANKITANEINAASVGGAVGNFVNISAEQITGGAINATIGMWASGKIVSGAWNGSCAIMSASEGFTTKQVNENDEQYTATSLGNPGGQNSLSIFNEANKPPVFEVSNDGSATMSSISVESDPVFKGRPLIGKTGKIDEITEPGWLDDIPRGVVAYGDLRAIMSNASFVGGAGTFTPLGTVSFVMEGQRNYKITLPMRYSVSSVTDATKARVGAALKYTTISAVTGSPPVRNNDVPPEPTSSSTHVADALMPMASSGAFGAGHTMSFVWRSLFGGPQHIKLLVGAWANHCTMTTDTYNPFDWLITIEDVGPLVPSSARLATTGGSNMATPQKYVSTWIANNSRSYYGNGNVDSFSSGKNILRHGYYDGNTLDLRSAYVCTGNASEGETTKTVAQALSGATIQKAEIFVQSLHWYYSNGGNAIFRPLGSSTIPGTLPTANVPSTSLPAQKFTTRSQGKWITVPNNWFSATATGVIIGPTANTNPAQYSYFANHTHPTVNYRPRIRITYTR